MNLGGLIAHERTVKGYTQMKLAEMSGVSRSYICDIENGRYAPSLKSLASIARALGLEFSLLTLNDGNTSKV